MSSKSTGTPIWNPLSDITGKVLKSDEQMTDASDVQRSHARSKGPERLPSSSEALDMDMSDNDGKEEPSQPHHRRLIRGTDLARKKLHDVAPSKVAVRLRRLARGEQPRKMTRATPEPPLQRRGRPVIVLRRSSSVCSGNYHRQCSRDRARRIILPSTLTPARRREIKARRRLLLHWKKTLQYKIGGHKKEMEKIEKELEGLVDEMVGEMDSD